MNSIIIFSLLLIILNIIIATVEKNMKFSEVEILK